MPARSPSPRGRSGSPSKSRSGPSGGKTAAATAAAEKNMQKLITRTVWGVFMFLYLLFVLWMGHGWVCLNVFLAQVEIFREMVNVRYHNREKEVPWFRSVQWAWFCVAVIYFYGGPLIKIVSLNNDVDWRSYDRLHKQIAFCVYAAVFVATVLVFKKGEYRYQMNQLAWTLLTLIMVVAQMQSVILNAMRGLIWFVVPTMLVVINDSMAYFAGFSMGKKLIDHEKYPFLKLSPNKTWEGFIGGGLATVFVGYYLPTLFIEHEWFVCRPKEINLLPVDELHCDIGSEFRPQLYTVKVAGPVRWLPGLIGMEEATQVYSSVGPLPCQPSKCAAHATLAGDSIVYPTARIDGLCCAIFVCQTQIERLWVQQGYSFWLYPEWETKFTAIPVQLYCLFLASFASLVAPFGGFFASAIKRAYDAKDFDTFIPGHGGLMDRLDCQFIMGLCVRASPIARGACPSQN